MIFSAETYDLLQQLVKNCLRHVNQHPDEISDLSYTLALRKKNLPHRAFAVFGDGAPHVSPSHEACNVPRIAMIFTGSGEGWPEMARDLIEKDASFAANINIMDDILRSLRGRPEWNIRGK